LMRLMEADELEERLLGGADFPQPFDRFIRNHLARVTLRRPDRLAVADEVRWVLMRRSRVVLRTHPMLKPVVPRLRLLLVVELAVEMPFADVTGRIAGILEQRCYRHFILPQMHHMPLRNPVVDANAARS